MIERNPTIELRGPRLGKRRPKALTRQEIQRLLAQPRGRAPRDCATARCSSCYVRAGCAPPRRSRSSFVTLTSTPLRYAPKPAGTGNGWCQSQAARCQRSATISNAAATRTPTSPRTRQLARRPAHPPGDLQDRPAPRAHSRADKPDQPAHAPPHLCDAPPRQRLASSPCSSHSESGCPSNHSVRSSDLPSATQSRAGLADRSDCR